VNEGSYINVWDGRAAPLFIGAFGPVRTDRLAMLTSPLCSRRPSGTRTRWACTVVIITDQTWRTEGAGGVVLMGLE
jgi:hypothetical protein